MLWSAISLYVKLEISRTSIVFLLLSSGLTPSPPFFISKSSVGMAVYKTEMEMLWSGSGGLPPLTPLPPPTPHCPSPINAPSSKRHGLKTMSHAMIFRSNLLSLQLLCHHLESLSELGLFAGCSESMVALVIPTSAAGHAHPQTDCTVVHGPSWPSLLLRQLQIIHGKCEQRAAVELITFPLSQMAQEEPFSYRDWPSSYQSKKQSLEWGGISYNNTRG